MKKTIILALLMCATAFTANAAYLYWQVGTEGIQNYNASTQYRVYMKIDGSTKQVYPAGGTAGPLGMPTPYELNLSDAGATVSSTFLIEVYSYDSSSVPQYTKVSDSSYRSFTYEELAFAGAITSQWAQGNIAQNMAVWTGRGVVPEPTSGMLTLIGLALLGLKRRRV